MMLKQSAVGMGMLESCSKIVDWWISRRLDKCLNGEVVARKWNWQAYIGLLS
jgi:hypothetical protein